ncbi:MAG: GerMN domain-containing protein [Lachnospiraceae bacterium]|jgi:germination protein M|nr:GerMN domain-containing protein [Lachnospiraceae bacterium]
MKKAGHLFFAAILVMGLLLCTACGDRREAQDGASYKIYYVNNEETKIVEREYVSGTTDSELLFEEFLEQLAHISEKMEYETLLDKEISVVGHTLDSGLLTLDFDGSYHNLRGTREILVRASIVRTMTQLPGVERIAFTVMGEQLMDASGAAVGVMAADTFIENAGNEINAYEKVDLKLYFANETGDSLVEENRRNVVYNSNISLEKLVVEKLVQGPMTQGAYPTINPTTKIVSVTVKDGTCYVNLSNEFLSQPYNVASDVTIYSITNSLVELSNVNRVQISVNGETNISYRENMSLNNVFERNLDILVPGTVQ